MTNEQAAARQASHENLMRELVKALGDAVYVLEVSEACGELGMRGSETLSRVRKVLARAKEQQQ